MERGKYPEYSTELDIYIHDYLMKRNFTTTAKTFMEETQARAFATDLKVIDTPEGLLFEWWSTFRDVFESFIDGLSCTEESAMEQKQLEMGHQHIQEEAQMELKYANLDNSRLSENVTLNQDLVPTLSRLHSGINRVSLPDSAVHPGYLSESPTDRNSPEHIQQQYEQSLDHRQPCQNMQQSVFDDIFVGENAVRTDSPQDGEGEADMLDLSGGVSEQKTTGVILEELISLKASSKKIFCCDFSSAGNLLASAGAENKVFVWNLSGSLQKHAWEAHSSFITDIRFQSSSTMLATSSSDKTVRLWDASQSGRGFLTLTGHCSSVRSVDFSPINPSFLCSTDDRGKILFWTIGQDNPRISQVAGRGKVRFHPKGDCLAAAIGSTLNVIQVERDERVHCFQGSNNNKFVQSICWSESGSYLAAVSEDCVRVWSDRGEHVHDLSGNLSFFRSCAFHPTLPDTLVIGGYQTITMWNLAENKRIPVENHSHSCYVSDLAASPLTGFLACASHDGSVKIAR